MVLNVDAVATCRGVVAGGVAVAAGDVVVAAVDVVDIVPVFEVCCLFELV